jgi:UDP-N-acetyl-D-glucosamine dehydrogenase
MSEEQTASLAELREKLGQKTANVAVVGLGYVGLPMAVELGKAGFTVAGIDVSSEKVATVEAGESDVKDVPAFEVAGLRATGKLTATTDFAVMADADVIVICVPTPLSKTRDPDVSYILNSCEQIRDHLRLGQLIVLESTTYPGTTQEVVLPLMEETGLRVGEDFFLAYSPERIDPGNKTYTLTNTSKVVGGTTPMCNEIAVLFYEQVISDVVPVSSTQTAEITKLLENTFRSVNIALVNEVALMCDKLNIDVWEVISAAATKPYGFMPFYPGPGLGGHCIPIDPHYLAWKLRTLDFQSRFIELASEVTRSMPAYVVTKVSDVLNLYERSVKGSSILVLGVTYKPNISDIRESPALDIIEMLQNKGAHVSYHDPFVDHISVNSLDKDSVALDEATVASADCIVIATHHDSFDYQWLVDHARCVFDTRNATSGLENTVGKVFKL